MKAFTLFFVIIIVPVTACKQTSVQKEYPETFYSNFSGSTNLVEVQKEMIQEFNKFYSNSDKKRAFYEVLWAKRMLINYNKVNKTLNVSVDICSGWLYKFKNVEEKDIKFLSDNKIEFDKYKLYVEPLGEVKKTETNAPCLSN